MKGNLLTVAEQDPFAETFQRTISLESSDTSNKPVHSVQ
jgi:hypothetical protein